MCCRLLTVFSALLLWHTGGIAQEQEKQPPPSPIRNFSPEEYRAHAQNWAVVQDYRGVIYVGNNDGVLEYDGTAWRLLSLPGGTGAFSLAVDSDGRPTLNGEDEIGRIYVGGAGALGILAPDLVGTMRYISLTEKIPEPHRDFVDRVVQILITPERVVFLSDKRLFIYQDDEIRVVVSDDHFFSCAYQGGTLYVIDGVKGLAKVNETGLESIDGGGCGALIRCCPMSRNSCLRCSYTEG